MKKEIGYYLFSSYRRKLLDKLLQKNISLYKGIVLDVGGRDRGKFKSPKDKVEKWIIADIESDRSPDIVLDVADMSTIDSNSIDVVNAIELFEHVENPEQGIRECFRVLKKDGYFLASMPFLHPIHADPYDFQRWTNEKWQRILIKKGFKIVKIEPMGGFFTIFADMTKTLINSFSKYLKFFFMILYPILDLLVLIDNTGFVLNNNNLNKYNSGYFIIGKK